VKARIETEEKMEKPTNTGDGILSADGLHCVTSKVPKPASLSLFLIPIQSLFVILILISDFDSIFISDFVF
jgi:hypothetical protein